jgi:hypothetical protein
MGVFIMRSVTKSTHLGFGLPFLFGELTSCYLRYVAKAREDGRFFGASFASDESPPNSNRYTGLRFQVTYVYSLIFKPRKSWDDPAYSQDYPFERLRDLCDIVHVPLKTGSETLKVIERQAATKGIYRCDLVSGTGDGGGENEGVTGVHSLMEHTAGDYVRRRCFGHLPWRVADAGIREIAHSKNTESISTHLRDGITWTRLGAIACQAPATGGLGLFPFASVAYRDVFNVAPPRVIEERPETLSLFLRWLLPRQLTIAACVAHDMRQRDLKQQFSVLARDALANRDENVLRRVDFVMIEKALFLFYRTKANPFIVGSGASSLDALVERASRILTDTSITDEVLALLSVSRRDLPQLGAREATTWVELAVLSAPGLSRQGQLDLMTVAAEHHARVAARMATHLKLNAYNISRSSWLSAQLLSKNAAEARKGANAFLHHLVRLRPHQRSPYEEAFVEDTVKMQQLEAFAASDPPKLLWHCGGAYADLFVFLSVRFLSAPDSVLDCEGVHAQWKWIEQSARGMKFKLLNAQLKLQNYLNFFGGFPDISELMPLIQAVRADFRALYEQATSTGNVAPRLRRDYVYSQRFNLRPTDIDLLKAAMGSAPQIQKTPKVSWGMYLRNLLIPHYFYFFSSLTQVHSHRYVLVWEHKSFAGRLFPGEGAAVGRPLGVAFFEKIETLAQGILIAPCDGNADATALELMTATVAEISKALGFFPALDDGATARDEEILHEEAFLSHDVRRFNGTRLLGASDDSGPWQYVLTDECDVEAAYFSSKGTLEDFTKIELARRLQLQEGETTAWREQQYTRLSKAALMAALAAPGPGHQLPPPALAPAAAALPHAPVPAGGPAGGAAAAVAAAAAAAAAAAVAGGAAVAAPAARGGGAR